MTDLPKQRSSTAQIFQISGIVLLLVTAIFTHSASSGLLNSILDTAIIFSIIIFVLFLWEIVTRLFDFFEEIKHISSRYEENWYNLSSTVFWFNKKTTVLCVVVLFLMSLGIPLRFNSLHFEFVPSVFIMSAAVYSCLLVGLHQSDLRMFLNLSNSYGMDYGSGMAYSFYYGYLRLILPETGDENKGIVEKINDFISSQQLEPYQFPLKKLIILIPTSAFINTSLADVYNDYEIDTAVSLETKTLNRAGVVQRVYKNSVYKIFPANNPEKQRPIYVAAEGATPLKTLYEVIEYGGTKGGVYRKYKNELVFNFYKTLKDIIRENPEVRDTCELIYYRDVDESGHRVNIARLILERIAGRSQ